MTHAERQARYRLRKQGLLPPWIPEHTTQLERNRKYYYGVDRTEFSRLITQQNHTCLICACSIDDKCCVDHDHTTGKVRGLLCNRCNLKVGVLETTPPDILSRMLTHLDIRL